jgi:hypothetical protein
MSPALEDDDPEDQSPVVGPSRPHLLEVLGPSLITGASDDDPSGIATYSQAGAQFAYGLAWTMIFTYPLMVRSKRSARRLAGRRAWASPACYGCTIRAGCFSAWSFCF